MVLIARYYIFYYLSYFINIFEFTNNEINQFLKWQNLASSGGEAKFLIKSGSVKVNGEIETRRGRKLNRGDKVMFLKMN